MKDHFTRNFSRFSKHLVLWHETQRDNSILEIAKNRSIVTICVFVIAFSFVGLRLLDVMLLRPLFQTNKPYSPPVENNQKLRSEIVDRNGEILATQISTASVYANPKEIINPEEAATELSRVIPELDYKYLLSKLKTSKGFIWIKRHVSPGIQSAIHYLGLPGIYLQPDQKRVNPYGNLVSHIIGCTNIDNQGVSGVEKYFDSFLTQQQSPLQLSIDVRLQHILRDELAKAISFYKCIGGMVMLADVKKGELLGMVSLPDFNPNLPNINDPISTFNQNTSGVFEPGSTFKALNVAIGLETKKISLQSIFDARYAIKVGRHSINDFLGKHRHMTTSEVFLYSSNIGAARIAQEFGIKVQQEFLKHFKIFQTPKIELPEVAAPLIPKHWGESTLYTVSFGHGIAVSPLQVFATIIGVINDGLYQDLTLMKQKPHQLVLRQHQLQRILSSKTSSDIRNLMRLTITEGSAKRANIPGIEGFGKTGTAEKVVGKGYSKNSRMTFFIGGFPKNDPQIMLYICLDGPKPVEGTHGFAAAGWNAAPTAGKIIYRIAPLLGFMINPDAADKDSELTGLLPVNQKIEVNSETE